MGMLDGLLRIKEFRERKAERELTHARHAVDTAQVVLDRARADLEKYQQQCRQRESEMYRQLLSRIVQKRDLDEVELEIKLMRERLPAFLKSIDDAEAALAAAEEALTKARQALQQAIRMRQKFSELVDIENREQALETLRREDLEMEEVKLQSPLQNAAGGDGDASHASDDEHRHETRGRDSAQARHQALHHSPGDVAAHQSHHTEMPVGVAP